MMGSRFLREQRLEQQRTDLLKVVRSRFGAQVSAEVTAAIQSVKNSARLDRLFDQLLDGLSLDDLRAALPAMKSRP